jgi:hypothetical protein
MHPIHKLLRSYSQGCLAYTTMARESLVGEGGVLQHTFSISEQLQPLLRDAYQRWRFEDFAFPFSLAMRGFDGRETFPDYPHREDGLLVWSAIVDFVKDYINLYYPSERSVREDKELQAWYQESFEVRAPPVHACSLVPAWVASAAKRSQERGVRSLAMHTCSLRRLQ